MTVIADLRNACVSAPLYPVRLDIAKICSLLTEPEGGLRLSVKSEEPEAPGLSALDIDHILPRVWKVPLAAERLQRGCVAAYSDESDIEVIVRSCGTLTPWQLLIRERHESIPMLGNLTLLNLSVTTTAQHCDFAAKRDKHYANASLGLNGPLIATSAWDEAAISARAHALANIALTICPKNE